METNKIYQGNCLDVLKTFPDNSIDCCVTSPPYFGLRDYGNDAQIGLEETPEKFVAALVDVFTEVKRVLKDEGTLWLNLGDSYAGSNGNGYQQTIEDKNRGNNGVSENVKLYVKRNRDDTGYKPKDLIGIPWLVAFALRSTGWYLRQDIIWHKPNPMPESVTDRCTKTHEYIFLLSKSSIYFYDAESIKEVSVDPESYTGRRERNAPTMAKFDLKNLKNAGSIQENGKLTSGQIYEKRNKRSVWTVTTKPYSESHFATFPEDLIVDMIKAGCPEFVCNKCGKARENIMSKTGYSPEVVSDDVRNVDKSRGDKTRRLSGAEYNASPKSEIIGLTDCGCNEGFSPGIVLDPFMGAGTTAIVAKKLNRNFIGIELNPKYIKIAEKRLYKEIGMFL